MNEKNNQKKTSLNRKKGSSEKRIQKSEKLEKYSILARVKIIQINGQKIFFMSQLTCLKN